MIYKDIFNKNTLNIFTDASISTKTLDNGEKVRFGCPGYVLVTINNQGEEEIVEQGYTIEYNSTNNNSEYKAILYGLQSALKYKDQFDFINLFSDSKVSIFGLREWMINWNLTEQNTLYNSSGVFVSNQDIIFRIMRTILDNGFRVNLFHQKGHVDDKNLDKAIKTFMESNNVRAIQPVLVKILSFYNNYVDNMTRQELFKKFNYSVLETPINKIIHQEEMKKYFQFIGKNI